jgi:hypothetical protein
VGCRPGAKHLNGVRCAICRIAESSKAAFKFLMYPLFSGYTNWPRLEKGKGKKRAAGVPVASVATAVDLGDEEGGELPAKRPNSSHLEEAEYAMGTLAGEPRANAHANYMELHKEGVARGATPCVSAQEYSCAVCAWISFVKMSCALRFTLSSRVLLARCRRQVTRSIAAPTRLHTKVELHLLAQSSCQPPPPPPLPSSIPASSASHP